MAEAEGVRKAALHRMMEAATMVHAEMEEVSPGRCASECVWVRLSASECV
jgi:hypothetical protein